MDFSENTAINGADRPGVVPYGVVDRFERSENRQPPLLIVVSISKNNEKTVVMVVSLISINPFLLRKQIYFFPLNHFLILPFPNLFLIYLNVKLNGGKFKTITLFNNPSK
jgi:hypothetical protein